MMWGSKPLFAGVPGKANFACTGLLINSGIAFLTAAVFAFMAFIERDNLHPVGVWLLGAILGTQVVLAIAGPTAAVLLSKRRRGARVVATVVSALFLVNLAPAIFWVPQFVIGVFVLISLWSADMRRFLLADRVAGAGPSRHVDKPTPPTTPDSVMGRATSPAALVYGILSVMFCFNFFPAGLGFGLLGLARYRADLRTGAAPSSRAALVCSAIGSAISALFLLFFAFMFLVVILTAES